MVSLEGLLEVVLEEDLAFLEKAPVVVGLVDLAVRGDLASQGVVQEDLEVGLALVKEVLVALKVVLEVVGLAFLAALKVVLEVPPAYLQEVLKVDLAILVALMEDLVGILSARTLNTLDLRTL